MEELLLQLAEIDKSLDALLAGDELTAEQTATHNKLVGDRAKKTAAIKREQDKAAREDERATLAADAEQAKARKASADERAKRIVPDAGSNRLTAPDLPAIAPLAGRFTIPAQARRYGPRQLRNFKGDRDGFRAEERAFRFGMYCLGILANDVPKFGRQLGRQVKDFWANNFEPNLQAVNLSNDSNGAQFLIPEEFSTDLIDLREQYGLVRQLFQREPMTSDTKTFPRRQSGLTAYPVGEGAAGTESTAIWNHVRLTAKDWMVITRTSNQVQADAAIAIGDKLAGEISYAFTYAEDNAGFNGDGTSTYNGIVGVRTKLTGTGTAGVATQGTSNTWSAITLADFHSVIGKLPLYAMQRGPVWVTHTVFWASVMQRLMMAAGGVTSQEVQDGANRPVFLGFPVRFSQVMPAATAVATLSALFGSFDLGASFGDRQMDTISISEEASVGGQSMWERNEIGWRGTERFDINAHDCGDATNAGPIVGLKTGP